MYYIKALHSAKALTVSSMNDGAEIRQHSPGSLVDTISKLQQFRVVDYGNGVESYMLHRPIKNKNGASVYGCISRSGPYAGDRLIIRECDNGFFQQWKYAQVGPGVHYEIRGVASDFYWHVQNESMADGARVLQWPGPGGYNARFRWTYAYSMPTINS
ncbi:RICIN domain-containing protein [Micromonospora chersina]|uniref:RICIN domain-containing protein n=1 Tax=Micromonospora chersina TaxID=47854 RepID=UPI003718BA56